MNLFRGDAHKIYCRLRKNPDNIRKSKYLKDVREVQEFYDSVESDVLRLIFYRLIKEKNGSGMIPIYVSAFSFLLMILSNHLHDLFFAEGRGYWMFFIFMFIYLIAITFSLFVHFREQAWAASHIEIIQDILEERHD